jgi:hypothetical protein
MSELREYLPPEVLQALPPRAREALLQELEAEFRRAPDAPDPPPAPRAQDPYRLWSLAEILTVELPEPTWVVPSFLPAGLASLCGRPKLGKSFLALQLAVAVGSGGVFLNQRVERGVVLYLALEDYIRRIKDRALRMAADAKAEVYFRFDFPPLNTREGLAFLEADIDKLHPRLVIVDTLARAVAGRVDWDDVGMTTSILSLPQRLAQEREIGILTLDHHSKLIRGDVIDDIIGSTGKAATYDTAWGFYRTDGRMTLKIVGRELEPRELVLEFDGVTGCWQLIGDASDVVTSEREAQVLDLLAEVGEVDTQTVAKELEITERGARKLLERMRDAGKLQARTVTIPRGGAKRVYAMRDAVPSVPNVPNANGTDGTDGTLGTLGTTCEQRLTAPEAPSWDAWSFLQ